LCLAPFGTFAIVGVTLQILDVNPAGSWQILKPWLALSLMLVLGEALIA
jgi:hypothetical protein